jgi:hypothetical protein
VKIANGAFLHFFAAAILLFSCLWWHRHSCLPCLPRSARGASKGLCS